MFNMHRETYPKLVLEFLSSLTITQDGYRETSLYFRIDRIERQLTIAELEDLFGLNDTRGGLDYEQHPSQICPLISREHLTNLQNLVLKKVHHPVIRIWLKFMTFTIMAKSESSKAESNDLIILGSFLRPKCGFTFNLARLLVHTFCHTINQPNNVRTPIQFGGLITQDAMHFGWRKEVVLSRETTTIRMTHLGQTWCKVHDRQIGIPLPTQELSDLILNRPT